MYTPTVLVVIPIIKGAKVEEETLNSLKNQKYDNLNILISEDEPIADNRLQNLVNSRNKLRDKALEIKSDYYLMLDSDVVLPENGINNLILQAFDKRKNKSRFDIIGGWYPLVPVQTPPLWSAGRWMDDHLMMNLRVVENSIVVVDKIELGCLLVSREVYEKIKIEDGFNNLIKIDNDKKWMPSCECLMFGKKAQDLGYTLYMNGDVICRHLKYERDLSVINERK
jgi:hypothetical protein